MEYPTTDQNISSLDFWLNELNAPSWLDTSGKEYLLTCNLFVFLHVLFGAFELLYNEGKMNAQ